MPKNTAPTYNFICAANLIDEFDVLEKKETEKKIKRRLKYYHLGDYDQNRVDYMRLLKNDLSTEISSSYKSKYWHKSKSKYSDLDDFDINQMVSDYTKKYNIVEKNEMFGIINYAIYYYHLR